MDRDHGRDPEGNHIDATPAGAGPKALAPVSHPVAGKEGDGRLPSAVDNPDLSKGISLTPVMDGKISRRCATSEHDAWYTKTFAWEEKWETMIPHQQYTK